LRTKHADYGKLGRQAVVKLVDDGERVYAATDQILKAGRLAVTEVMNGEE
jgi:uncharacterized protein YbjT (DUF2867 family)